MAYRKKNGKAQEDSFSNASVQSNPSSPAETVSPATPRIQKSRASTIIARRKASARKDEIRVKRPSISSNREKREPKTPKKALVEANQPPNNGRHVGRQLIRWNHSTEQLLLLTIHYECSRQGIQVPYDAIARRMFAEKDSTGASIIQHLGKLRLATLARGAWVPPLVGKGRKNVPIEEDIRGLVRCKYGGGNQETRVIGWNEDASMLISQDDIISRSRTSNGPVYFQDEAGHRTSVAPTSTRRTAGRRRTLVDSESEIEADPADLDADAEYKPYVKGNSVPVKKENEFPSLFPPEPRLILVLRTKPGHLIEFPPGISGPDDDDYQRGEVWGPHEDADCEDDESHDGKGYPYAKILTNVEQASTEIRYANEVREAEEEYKDNFKGATYYRSIQTHDGEMTYSAPDTDFRQCGPSTMKNVWTPQEVNINRTYRQDFAAPMSSLIRDPSSGNAIMTEFDTREPLETGHYMQRTDSYVDQSDNRSEAGRNIHQESDGFIGPNDLLLQQPYYPQQHHNFSNQHSSNSGAHVGEVRMFDDLSNQQNNSQEMEFGQPQSALPSHISSLDDYFPTHGTEDRSYQSASGDPTNQWQFELLNRSVTEHPAPIEFNPHGSSQSAARELTIHEDLAIQDEFSADVLHVYSDGWPYGLSDFN